VGAFTLSDLVKPLGGELHGKDATFEFVSIDTRTIKPGELYVAIKGPQFDGHAFLEAAKEKGAVAAIVSEDVKSSLPTIKVKDTAYALGILGALRREQLIHIPLLAITGSCGKTTTKTMMASILEGCGKTLSSIGTMNNAFGLPLTLLRLTAEHEYAVVEMGANHFEEIAYLTNIARPTVAGITLAGPVHLEGFGNVYGVAQAKGEIFRGLLPEGVALINGDDEQANYWKTLVLSHRKIIFGKTEKADIRAVDITADAIGQPSFTLQTPKGSVHIKLPLLGEHNVTNALAAAAGTFAIGISLEKIKHGLENVPGVNKRLNTYVGLGGATIIDDTYNANPLGVKAALEVLAKREGEKILVLGSMGELGDLAPKYHHEMGEQALAYGVKKLFTYGDLTHFTVKAFGHGAQLFSSHEELIQSLKPHLGPQVNVLVKGSRSTHMETVVSALCESRTQDAVK